MYLQYHLLLSSANANEFRPGNLCEQDMDRFGGAIDSAEEGQLMIVGDEYSSIDG